MTNNQEPVDAPMRLQTGTMGPQNVGAGFAGPARRLEYIDGLRALAALWVCLHHVLETAAPAGALASPVLGPLIATLALGQFPVMVFLMLSGFCLYYPYVKRSPGPPEFSGFRTYVARRATRIAPPYLWAGGFCLVMGAVPALQVGRWKGVGTLDPKVILTHLLFIHNLIPSHAAKIDYPMWSVGLECQLYLLFPIMMWSFRASRPGVVIFACLALSAMIRMSSHHLPGGVYAALHDGPLSYLEIFGAGMLAAALTARGHTHLAPNWVLGCVVVAGAIVVRLGTGNGLVHDVATGAATFCVLLLAADADGLASRVLSWRPLVSLGLFSYSIYLVHAPLLHLAWFALARLGLPSDTLFLVLILGCLPPIIAISYGFHLIFERPFMKVGAARSASRVERVGPATQS